LSKDITKFHGLLVKLKQEIETLSAKRDRNEDIYVETRLCEGEINTLFDDLPEIN
jgi:hypothetical protein